MFIPTPSLFVMHDLCVNDRTSPPRGCTGMEMRPRQRDSGRICDLLHGFEIPPALCRG